MGRKSDSEAEDNPYERPLSQVFYNSFQVYSACCGVLDDAAREG